MELTPNLDAHLTGVLKAAFESSGWRVKPSSAPGTLQVSAPRRGVRYLARVKAWPDNRHPLLASLLASAAVEAQYAAQKTPNILPLAVVGTPRVTEALSDQLRRYAETYLPDMAFGWVDGTGRLSLHGPQLHEVTSAVASRPAPKHLARHDAGSKRTFRLFSDLNQWLLKVLLAPRLPEKFLTAPRTVLRSARHLAEVAEVSVPTAARLIAYLRAHHFLATDGGDLRLARVPELLEQWRVQQMGPIEEQRMCWLFPSRVPSEERLKEALRRERGRVRGQSARACLGLFSACDALGLSWVRGVPPHLYVASAATSFLHDIGLRPAQAGDPVDVMVRRPTAPEALFRSCVVIDDLQVADVLQCWLDVAHHPARGAEQRAFIESRVLNTLLEEG